MDKSLGLTKEGTIGLETMLGLKISTELGKVEHGIRVNLGLIGRSRMLFVFIIDLGEVEVIFI